MDKENPCVSLINSNCIDVLTQMSEESVDSIVTDPPYGISYAEQGWDRSLPSIDIWRECHRVLKPGAHIAVFGHAKTFHRLTSAIEDAGFEIRDCMMWIRPGGMVGGGDISRAIDKSLGHSRGKAYKVESYKNKFPSYVHQYSKLHQTPPVSPEAAEWDGWRTTLKPGFEPIILARKPFKGATYKNVLRHRTGALNIDPLRFHATLKDAKRDDLARYPENVFIDTEVNEPWAGHYWRVPKASPREKHAGLDPAVHVSHPTVKPIELMKRLVTLITPPEGLVLDPFCGSGTTGIAAADLKFQFLGVEMNADYVEVSRARIEHWTGIRPGIKPLTGTSSPHRRPLQEQL